VPTRWSRHLYLLAVLILLATSAFAQATGGNLVGRVTDETGAALPGVTLTATNTATGASRTAVTTADGAYRIASLPVGTYSLAAELAGFSTVTTKNVDVQVATDRTINVTLKQGAVKDQITVTAEAPLVATSPSVGTVVSQRELENLPLNGRQFANLGTLAPGTSLSVNSDPTKPGQLTIALNGGSGRNVNFLIDGGDNTDDTIGGALQNFNIEAVQEFKIQTMAYKAEYGRSSGGVLSVVTKSGTNELSGSAYEFYRNKSLNSVSESERLNNAGEKGAYRRDQYGASLGGPIVRDKAHFFATWEKTNRTTAYNVNTGRGLLGQYEGQNISLPFHDELGTAKVSFNPDAKQFLQVRYGYQKNADKYGQSALAAPTSLGTVANDYKSLLAGHTLQIGSNKTNEFLFQFTKFANAITADSTDPYIYFPSGAHMGQSVNTPQTTNQKKYQYKDDFSWSSQFGQMHHDFKAGAQYVNEPTLGGDFTVGTTGQFSLRDDKVGSPVVSIIYFGGFSGDSTPIKQYNGYFQDDIGVNRNLTVNAGLRWDTWTGFDLNQSLNPNLAGVQKLVDAGKYTESYLQGFKNGGGTTLQNPSNNWSPRLGFTYDLRGDSRNILRGGAGRYYDFPYTNANILFPASAVQSLYGVVYNYEDPNGIKNANGSPFKPGDPLPPNQVSGVLTDRRTRELAAPDVAKAPYSDQVSLGYSTEVGQGLGLNFEAVSARYHDIPYRFRANPVDPATGKRRFSAFAPSNFRLWRNDGHAEYDGFNVGFHSRMGDRFEAQGFYTLSRSKGNILAGADEFRVFDAGHQTDITRDTSVNPLNPDCSACNGPLDTDARHRVTLSTVYRAPYGINVSGILRWHSGTPYTVFAYGANTDPLCDQPGHKACAAKLDLNGDGYTQDLAPGHTHVNDARGPSFSQIDVRLAKEFPFAGHYGVEVMAEVFNLLNAKNANVFDSFGHTSAYAGDPGQGEQRLVQLGARLRF
jgi:hypothetical protein